MVVAVIRGSGRTFGSAQRTFEIIAASLRQGVPYSARLLGRPVGAGLRQGWCKVWVIISAAGRWGVMLPGGRHDSAKLR